MTGEPITAKIIASLRKRDKQRDKQQLAKAQADLAKAMRQAAQDVRNRVRPKSARVLVWTGCQRASQICAIARRKRGLCDLPSWGEVQYFYSMSRAEAREWFDDDSAGWFFNSYVRE